MWQWSVSKQQLLWVLELSVQSSVYKRANMMPNLYRNDRSSVASRDSFVDFSLGQSWLICAYITSRRLPYMIVHIVWGTTSIRCGLIVSVCWEALQLLELLITWERILNKEHSLALLADVFLLVFITTSQEQCSLYNRLFKDCGYRKLLVHVHWCFTKDCSVLNSWCVYRL